MVVRIAINGLGRIGRQVLRAVFEEKRWGELEIVSINGPASADVHAHLLKYDSVHGVFKEEIKAEENALVIAGRRIPLTRERDTAKLDWKGVDIVLECTGKFTKRADAELHLKQGAKKVLISAPSPDAEATIVYGVNNDALKPDHKIISVGSCTTNCLAPVAKVLHDNIGIEVGFMTTIHSYTSDQNIHDGSHKDLRRARAAALSMVPTSTGAAKALSLVLPSLEGKLDGAAIRVPTPNVSLVDLKFTATRDTSVSEINELMKDASLKSPLKGVLAYNDEQTVSIDYNHHPASSIFDSTQTKVLQKRFCRAAAWYDNEWGFSLRMLDVAVLAGSR